MRADDTDVWAWKRRSDQLARRERDWAAHTNALRTEDASRWVNRQERCLTQPRSTINISMPTGPCRRPTAEAVAAHGLPGRLGQAGFRERSLRMGRTSLRREELAETRGLAMRRTGTAPWRWPSFCACATGCALLAICALVALISLESRTFRKPTPDPGVITAAVRSRFTPASKFCGYDCRSPRRRRLRPRLPVARRGRGQ